MLATVFAHPALADGRGTDDEKLAHAHLKQGKAYLEAGVFDDAIKEFQAGYELSPQPEFMYDIGQAYRLKGEPVLAKEAYVKYVALVTDGDLADKARVFIATLTKQILDAKNRDEETKRKADEAAGKQTAGALETKHADDVKRATEMQLAAARSAHDAERESRRHGRKVGWTFIAVGGGLVVAATITVLACPDCAVLGGVMGVVGLVGLSYGIPKRLANSDIGEFTVAPTNSGGVKGLVVSGRF